jgi:hypothetical protein
MLGVIRLTPHFDGLMHQERATVWIIHYLHITHKIQRLHSFTVFRTALHPHSQLCSYTQCAELEQVVLNLPGSLMYLSPQDVLTQCTELSGSQSKCLCPGHSFLQP